MYRRWIVTSLEHHIRPLVQWIESWASNPEVGVQSSQGRPSINIYNTPKEIDMITTKVTWKDYRQILDQHKLKYFDKAVELAGNDYVDPVSWQELDNGDYEITRAWPNLETAEAFLTYVKQEEESKLLVSAVLSSQ